MADVGVDRTSTAESQSAASGRRGSRDPKLFVLLRELSEVHLLLDNVSANPNTTVTELMTGSVPEELGADWIEKVCKISWPPEGPESDRAEDAALLIRAKDYLNSLVRPSSGSTIAFTLLVTQERDDVPWWKVWDGAGADGKMRQSPTRRSLAKVAYPDLIGKAAAFRIWMYSICLLLLVVLVFTCGLSWYVAYGNASLAEYATVEQSLRNAVNRVSDAESAESSATGASAAGEGASRPMAGKPGEGATVKDAPPAVTDYCLKPYASVPQSQACEALARSTAESQRVETRLLDWLEDTPLIGSWVAGRRAKTDAGPAREPLPADAPARAAAFANIMGSAVLPFLYGLLGAGAAIVRSLSRKIRASLLSPRDLQLALQQLALGAVIGACIGLFIAAPGGQRGGESLLGPVTLSASAISFIAGFGVDAVFQTLEALIVRIFNLAPLATSNRGDGVGRN
jgi:hypothetical protein